MYSISYPSSKSVLKLEVSGFKHIVAPEVPNMKTLMVKYAADVLTLIPATFSL